MFFSHSRHEVFFKILFIYLFFRERGREGETEGEKHHMCPNREQTCNSGMCLHWELNWQTFALRGDAQPTEPHQSGLDISSLSHMCLANSFQV